MSAEPTILHADVDSFFASVEQRDDPGLRGRPVIVGGGVVLAASYEAKAYGVRGAMGGAQARRLCPHAVVVVPRFEAYVAASKELFAVFDRTAPRVEGLGFEEAFLDVRGLGQISGTPREIAVRLRREVRDEVGLPITVGVARTKVLAKMASRTAKPDGLLVLAPEDERAFLHPLPVERIWGVGAAGARKLHARGVMTVGQAAALTEATLMSILGKASGRYVHAVSNNRDPRPVRGRRRRRTIGAQRALGRRRRSAQALDAIVVGLVDRLARRLRGARRACRTVVLRLRFDDYARATRSHTLAEATTQTLTILTTARLLLAESLPAIERRGITLVGLTLANLEDEGAIQLALPLDRRRTLDATLDEVRDRFGAAAITRAALLGRDHRPSMPPPE